MAGVLIVEDEPKIASLLADYLAQSDFDSYQLDHGDLVMPWLAQRSKQQQFGLQAILLDLMLPGTDGIQLCKSIRQQSDVPILMVTARVEEIDRLLGLELGADDYICKPFSPREVIARIKAVLRRGSNKANTNSLLELDDSRLRAHVGGVALDLTAVEYQLLSHLASHVGHIYSRQQLMDIMYNDARVVSDRTVDSHIKKLRRKLQKAAPAQELIHSVYGLGYRYEEIADKVQ